MTNQSISSIINTIDQEVSLTLAFGHDYRQLNKLAFLRQALSKTLHLIDEAIDSGFQSIQQDSSSSIEKLKQLHESIKDAKKLKSTGSLKEKEAEELDSTLLEDQAAFQNHCNALNVSADNAEKQLALREQQSLIEAELENVSAYFQDFYTTANTDITTLSQAMNDLKSTMDALSSAEADDDIDTLAEKQAAAEKMLQMALHATTHNVAELIKEADTLIKKHSALSDWQKTIFQAYKKALAKIDIHEPTIDHFLTFLLTKGNEFLPREYISWGSTIPSEQKFPSSAHLADRHRSGYAHFQPCTGDFGDHPKHAGLLASCAPPKAKKSAGVAQEETDKINHDRLQTYLEMLFEEGVEHIIELGSDKNDVRLNYCTTNTEKFSAELDEDDSLLYVTNNKTHITKAIYFSHIPVDDQKPLNLANEELNLLLDFHHRSKQGVVLAHCDSGVGRTGQVALLLGMQNYFSNNPKVYEKVLELIEQLTNKKPLAINDAEKLIKQVYRAMARTLNQLRKIRYSVEQQEQFSSSFGQLLLLAASANDYQNEAINSLRTVLGIAQPVRVAIVSDRNRSNISACTSVSVSPMMASSPTDGTPSFERHNYHALATYISPTYETLETPPLSRIPTMSQNREASALSIPLPKIAITSALAEDGSESLSSLSLETETPRKKTPALFQVFIPRQPDKDPTEGNGFSRKHLF